MPETLTGGGPFVIWSISGPDVNGVDLYAVNVAGGGVGEGPPKIFLGNFLDVSAPFPEAPASHDLVPLVVDHPSGPGISILRRTGFSTLEQGPLQLSQGNEALATADGMQCAWLEHVSGGLYTVMVRSLSGSDKSEIRFSVPGNLPGSVPTVVDWDPAQRRFFVGFTGGNSPPTSMYRLTHDGTLRRMQWLDDYELFGNGTATADGSKFVFGEPLRHVLLVADFRQETIKAIKSTAQAFVSPVLSPDGTLVAYAHEGGVLEISRVSNGLLVGRVRADAAAIFPLSWLDNGRLIALEQSPDLTTGNETQALVLVTVYGSQDGGLSLSNPLGAGSIGFNYVGWLR